MRSTCARTAPSVDERVARGPRRPLPVDGPKFVEGCVNEILVVLHADFTLHDQFGIMRALFLQPVLAPTDAVFGTPLDQELLDLGHI